MASWSLMKHGRMQVLFRLITVLGSLAVLFLVAEAAIRFLVPPAYWLFRDAASDWRADPELGWVQKPNLDVTTISDRGWTVEFSTNRDGVAPASAVHERSAGVARVMVFGDSVVVGRAVAADQRIEAWLGRLLGEAGIQVEVYNAGVQGYSTDQTLLRMERLLPLYKPDVALYGFCDNDLGGNVSESAYGLFKPRFRLNADGSLQLQPSPPNPESMSGERSWKSWPQKSAVYRLLQPSILAVRARLGSWNECNMLGLASELYYRPEAMDSVDWRLFTAMLSRMRRCAEENGARLILYSHPAIEAVWEPFFRDTVARLELEPGQYQPMSVEDQLQAAASSAGVTFVPLVETFLGNQDRGPFHLLPRDPHCNGAGYRLTAETLAPKVAVKLRAAVGSRGEPRARR